MERDDMTINIFGSGKFWCTYSTRIRSSVTTDIWRGEYEACALLIDFIDFAGPTSLSPVSLLCFPTFFVSGMSDFAYIALQS